MEKPSGTTYPTQDSSLLAALALLLVTALTLVSSCSCDRKTLQTNTTVREKSVLWLLSRAVSIPKGKRGRSSRQEHGGRNHGRGQLASLVSGSVSLWLMLSSFFFKPQDHQPTEWYFLQGSGPFHINYQSRKWTHAHRPQANLVTMISQQSLLFQPSPRCVKMTVNANLDSTPMLLIHTPVTALPFYHCG